MWTTPFQKLVNQGMIQGRSNFVYRINEEGKDHPTFVSLGLKDNYDVTPIHVDVNIVKADQLDIEAFKAWRPEYENAEFILEDGKYICGWAIEKMSKSMFNVVNPDMIVEKYGADGEQKFWPSLLSNLKCGIRHYGQLFVAIVMTVIILLIVSVILLLPAIVVALANFHANLGVLYGDPLGMPSYIVPLTAVVMAFAGFVEVILRCGFHFIGYYCYGSIDTQEEEKKKFNQEIQNI